MNKEALKMAKEEAEAANRRCLEAESRCEQLLLAKEKNTAELRCQKEMYSKELEILRSSESQLKKAVEVLQAQYGQLMDDLFELRVVECYYSITMMKYSQN